MLIRCCEKCLKIILKRCVRFPKAEIFNVMKTKTRKLKQMRKTIIYCITLLAISSCGGSNGTSDESTKKIAQISEFKVDIQPNKINDREYKVIVNTNFPDETKFMISASREYMRKNNQEIYAVDLYSNSNAIVKNGLIEFTFSTYDGEYISEYKALQKQNGLYDNTLTDIDFSTMKDSIEISVLFTPKSKQSSTTVQVAGENGEKLSGEGVEDYSGFKILRKSVLVFDKYTK